MRQFSFIIIGIMATVLALNAIPLTAAATLYFSGYNWTIQKISTPTGIGNTRFWYNSSSDYVDGNGYLHMGLLRVGGVTYSSGINNTQALGYGTYTFDIQGNIGSLDKCAVLGIFTWDNEPEVGANLYNREIDFLEASKWCEASVSKTGSSVVQPADAGQYTGQYTTFNVSTPDDVMLTATWLADYVNIRLSDASTSRVISNWTYTGSNVPTPGHAFMNINLWQYNTGTIATSQQVVIKSFGFTPAGSSACLGTPSLSLSPNPAGTSSSVSATVSGLSNCNGAVVTIKDYQGCSSGATMATFASGASGGSVGIGMRGPAGQYGYYACINGRSSAKAILTISGGATTTATTSTTTVSTSSTTINSCSGSVLLALSPSTANPSSAFTASVSGLSNCGGQAITIKDYQGCSSGTTLATFTSGTTGGSVSLDSPGGSGQYGYYACMGSKSSAKETLTVN